MFQLDSGVKFIDVVILVSSEYCKNYHPDDLALKEAIDNRGYTAEIVAWDDLSFDFSQVKVAIVRSCWDYDKRVDEFIHTMKNISQKCILLNSFDTILLNSNKYYLMNLEARGIRIVPTVFIKHLNEVESALKHFETKQVVIKPVVSASGRNTYRMKRDSINLIKDKVEELLKHKDVMIQAYINTIETKGEKSTVVIDGQCVYTMLKKPAPGEFLVHKHWGGTYVEGKADLQDQAFIQQVISSQRDVPVYMRIDYLFDNDNSPMLLELELIEPNLYLSVNELGLKLLVDRVITMVNLK